VNDTWAIRVIFDTGESSRVLADKQVCSEAYNEWVESMDSYEDESKLIQIEGFTDSADKAPLLMAVKVSSIKCISIWKMY
jgi:hypothetical protein